MERELTEGPTLESVRSDCPCCLEYISGMSPMYRIRYEHRAKSYRPRQAAVEELRDYVDDFEIVVVFADWCGDAQMAVPALAALERELGIRIRALGGMTKPPFGSDKHWAVPPSPEEVDIFGITSSPTILIFEKSTGHEIGRIKTRPRMTPTIEEEILLIIKTYRGD